MKYYNEYNFTTYHLIALKKIQQMNLEENVINESIKISNVYMWLHKTKIENTISYYLEKKRRMKWYLILVVRLTIKTDKNWMEYEASYSGTTNISYRMNEWVLNSMQNVSTNTNKSY